MPYKAVVFDLYGTLVDNFSRKGYDLVQKEMAKILGVPYPKFWQTMGETITETNRSNGCLRSTPTGRRKLARPRHQRNLGVAHYYFGIGVIMC